MNPDATTGLDEFCLPYNLQWKRAPGGDWVVTFLGAMVVGRIHKANGVHSWSACHIVYGAGIPEEIIGVETEEPDARRELVAALRTMWPDVCGGAQACG